MHILLNIIGKCDIIYFKFLAISYYMSLTFSCCRRKKDNRIFLVAFYECDDDYELEDLTVDRLYCSKQEWIGTQPFCISSKSDDEGEFL